MFFNYLEIWNNSELKFKKENKKRKNNKYMKRYLLNNNLFLKRK
jgi:hypothetical protein